MVLRVAGVAPGTTAVLTVESPDANVVRTDDGRCTYARARATCQVSGADLSPVSLEVVAPQGAQVVASVSAPQPDPDTSDNTWRAVLG